MRSKISNNFGISIIEVVIAVSIIAIGMMGVMSLMLQNIRSQYINKNVLIAAGLAQEGLELVRNVRDLNWLTPTNSWDQGLALTGQSHNFIIDYSGRNSMLDVASIDAPGTILKINSEGLYNHTAGADSIFKRLMTVSEVTDPSSGAVYLDLRCTIRWSQGNQNRDYVAETYLYNWR